MSFGGGGFGLNTSPFGQQQQQSTGFGGSGGFGGGFGNAGAQTNTGGFGSAAGGLGGRPTGFGAASASQFGAGGFGSAGGSSSFGAASGNAFGSAGGGFGQGGTVGGSFGAAGGSSFGAPAQTATTPFGSSTGGLGGGFGAQQSPGGAQGTRGVQYQVTQETDSLGSGYGGQTGKYVTITAMPAYRQKSVEELRYEDYKQGVKGNVGASPGGGGAFGGGAFGAASSQSSFGSAANSPFGASQPTGGFGTPSPGGFGSSMSPAGGTFGGGGGFGAAGGFGASSAASAFGSAAPAFGAGAASAGAFGATPGAFGMQASAPAFGAGAASAPSAFGGGAFGATTGAASTPAFGMGGTPGGFGATSAPAFGGGAFGAASAPSSTPGFGMAGSFGAAASAPTAFGGAFGGASAGSSTPGFGSVGGTPAFGGGAFGASAPASTPGFGFSSAAMGVGASAPGMFGAASAAGVNTFGASFSSTPAIGGMSAGAFGASGGMFGATSSAMFGASSASFGAFGAAPGASASAGMFGNLSAPKPLMPTTAFASQPALSLSPAPTLGGTTPSFSFAGAGGFQSSASLFSSATASSFGGMTTPGLSNPTTPGSVLGAGATTPASATPSMQAGTPYGQLPQLPAPQTPGDADASKRNVSGIASASRSAHTMLSPRLITPRSAMRMRPRRSPGASPSSLAGGMMSPHQRLVSKIDSPRSKASCEDSPVIVARENPRKLFVRDPVLSPFSSNSLPLSDSLKSPLAIASSSHSAQGKASSHSKGARMNGDTTPSVNGTASKELKFLSPESTRAKSPATPIMLSDVSVERRSLQLPTIQNREYYSEPSLDDLARWTKSDPTYLEAVPNFLVGRKGYGELRFKVPVDLRNVMIDKIVQFGDKEVRVYMDNQTVKPPPGEGLNKPAVITLYNVHKMEKGTDKIVKDKAKLEAFEKKLQERAQAQDAEFISYKQEPSNRNPKGGAYSFAVKHFSKYDGFVDESSDEEIVEQTTVSDIVYSDDRNLIQAMAIDSKLDPSEIVMLQRDVPIIEVAEATPIAKPTKILRHSWKRTPSPLVGYKKSLKEVNREDVAGSNYDVSIKKMMNHCQVECIPVKHSCINGKTDKITDAAAILGRSFRVGWGPSGKFAHSGFWSYGRAQSKQSASVIHIERLSSGSNSKKSCILNSPVLETDRKVQNQCTEYLEVHSEYSKELHVKEGDQVISQELRRRLVNVDDESVGRVCDSYIEAVESVEEDDVQKLHLLGVWKLITCMFQHINVPSGDPDEYNIIRRQKFSQWLRDHATWAVDNFLQSGEVSELESIVQNLSKNDIRKATEQSLLIEDVRLASLISMAGCHTNLKEDIRQQLEVWNANSMEHLIHKQRLHVYELLSGKLDNILSHYMFDWRRSLACILWYEQTAVDPVAKSIHSYLDFKKRGIAPQSLPMYNEFGNRPSKNGAMDTTFELMRLLDKGLKPDVKSILNTRGYTVESLDYSLSWHMLSVLEGLGVLNFDSSDTEDQQSMLHIHYGYLLQLEFLGVGPEWMLYVASHIPNSSKNPYLRERIISEILSRTVSQWVENQDRIDFLTEKLGIPGKWMSGAKALWHKYRHEYDLEFEAHLNAESYPEAFSVFSEQLGPRTFFREGNFTSHAFIPFPFVELKAKIDALYPHKDRLSKSQQEELDLYNLFVSLMESGSKGEVQVDFEVFLERLAAKDTAKSFQSSKTRSVVSKMCTVYAETLRYCNHENVGAGQRASTCTQTANISFLTPEQAMVQIQDAATILSEHFL